MAEQKKLFWLIGIATLVRIIVAVTVDLGNDEVYYVTYAQHLQWNYFDHPPMVALLIRLTTFNLYFSNEFFIRLGPIILSAINTVLIFNCAKKITDEQAGFIAALLFTASPYCSIIAGTFILPDAPQLFFWILSISILIDILLKKHSSKNNNYKLLWFGLLSGLCIMSKIHGIFLWVGFGSYILFNKRNLLNNPYLYAAAIITAIVVAPILIWNIENSFITYTFHSDRVAIKNGLQADSFLRELAGGIFYNNPINYFLIILALLGTTKKICLINTEIKKLLLFLSLPLIILLFTLSMFRDTLPHWSGPAYIPLIIIAGCFISYKLNAVNSVGIRLKKITFLSITFILVVTAAGIMLINFMPGTIGKKDIAVLGDGDFTLDMYGWKEIKNKFKTIQDANIKNNASTTSFVINNKWFPGAHIDNYIAQPLHLNFIAIGELNDIHTYAWLNQYRKKIQRGNDAYFITVSNNFYSPDNKYKILFEKILSPVIIPQYRSGKIVRNVYIYLCKNYKGN
jgi:4-amino-4-deoxy-L-arabinose transferase-like glycosyltransferase